MRKEAQFLFREKQSRPLLSLFFTAGYPALDSTVEILRILDEADVDFIELGMPFSDPIADGPVIQAASSQAISHGMTPEVLLRQAQDIRSFSQKPIFIMGYFNPVLQFGVERFLAELSRIGIDGVILPDLPILDYERKYRKLFERYHISNVFLATPLTSEERLRQIDQLSTTFIYLVSTPSITGGALQGSDASLSYLERVRGYGLRHPLVVGFGIANREAFDSVTQFADGAIVGTAFLRILEGGVHPEKINAFVSSLRGAKGEL